MTGGRAQGWSPTEGRTTCSDESLSPSKPGSYKLLPGIAATAVPGVEELETCILESVDKSVSGFVSDIRVHKTVADLLVRSLDQGQDIRNQRGQRLTISEAHQQMSFVSAVGADVRPIVDVDGIDTAVLIPEIRYSPSFVWTGRCISSRKTDRQ